jgi:hypothetical protein
VSHRTSDFNTHFKISDSLAGKNIDGETVSMPNAKKYLVQKFDLGSTRAKADVILRSQETALTKAGNLVDLGFKDAADLLVEAAGSLYKAAPSLAVAGLTLGTAQMGSKMFDGITHAPANYLAYAADLTSSYVAATKAVVGSWFGKYNSTTFAPEVDIARVEEGVGVIINPKIGSNLIDQSTQNDLLEEKKSDEEDVGQIYCGDSAKILSQFHKLPSTTPKNLSRNKKIGKTHVHGPNCNHI